MPQSIFWGVSPSFSTAWDSQESKGTVKICLIPMEFVEIPIVSTPGRNAPPGSSSGELLWFCAHSSILGGKHSEPRPGNCHLKMQLQKNPSLPQPEKNLFIISPPLPAQNRERSERSASGKRPKYKYFSQATLQAQAGLCEGDFIWVFIGFALKFPSKHLAGAGKISSAHPRGRQEWLGTLFPGGKRNDGGMRLSPRPGGDNPVTATLLPAPGGDHEPIPFPG